MGRDHISAIGTRNTQAHTEFIMRAKRSNNKSKLPCSSQSKPIEFLIRGCVSEGTRATIEKVDAEAILIKGPHREKKGDEKESEYRG